MSHLFIVLKVRDGNGVTADSIKSFFQYTKYLCTYELGKSRDNPHYHIIAQSELNANAMRNKISRYFGIKGSDRTIQTVKDLESSVVYILKDFDVIKNTLFTNEEFEEYKSITSRVNEVKNQTKGSRKESFKFLFIQKYEKIPEPKLGYNLEDIYHHIDTYIRHRFQLSPVEQLDEMIYRRHFFKLMNYYYPKIMQKITSQWYSKMNLPMTLDE